MRLEKASWIEPKTRKLWSIDFSKNIHIHEQTSTFYYIDKQTCQIFYRFLDHLNAKNNDIDYQNLNLAFKDQNNNTWEIRKDSSSDNAKFYKNNIQSNLYSCINMFFEANLELAQMNNEKLYRKNSVVVSENELIINNQKNPEKILKESLHQFENELGIKWQKSLSLDNPLPISKAFQLSLQLKGIFKKYNIFIEEFKKKPSVNPLDNKDLSQLLKLNELLFLIDELEPKFHFLKNNHIMYSNAKKNEELLKNTIKKSHASSFDRKQINEKFETLLKIIHTKSELDSLEQQDLFHRSYFQFIEKLLLKEAKHQIKLFESDSINFQNNLETDSNWLIKKIFNSTSERIRLESIKHHKNSFEKTVAFIFNRLQKSIENDYFKNRTPTASKDLRYKELNQLMNSIKIKDQESFDLHSVIQSILVLRKYEQLTSKLKEIQSFSYIYELKLSEANSIYKKIAQLQGNTTPEKELDLSSFLEKMNDILVTKKENRASYHYLGKNIDHFVNSKNIEHLIKNRASDLLKNWHQILANETANMPSMTDQDFYELIELTESLRLTYNNICQQLNYTIKETAPHIFQVWDCHQLDETHLEAFIEWKSHYSDHELFQIIAIDQNIQDKAIEIRNNTFEAHSSAGKIPEPLQMQNQQKISSKAKEVLKILNGEF